MLNFNYYSMRHRRLAETIIDERPSLTKSEASFWLFASNRFLDTAIKYHCGQLNLLVLILFLAIRISVTIEIDITSKIRSLFVVACHS